jgi:hypothetical protein
VPGLTSVSFGGAAATVNSVTSTSISATTPGARRGSGHRRGHDAGRVRQHGVYVS